MSKLPEIIPITDLRQDSSAVLERVRTSRQPLIITQRGRAAAVMLSVEEYERTENERQILMLLARGEKEISAGDGHDLEEVLAEADRLLGDGAIVAAGSTIGRDVTADALAIERAPQEEKPGWAWSFRQRHEAGKPKKAKG